MSAAAKRRRAVHVLQLMALHALAQKDARCPKEVLEYLDHIGMAWRDESQKREELEKDERAADLLDRLRTATPQQIVDYVDAQVTDLASARTMFKRVLLVLALVAR